MLYSKTSLIPYVRSAFFNETAVIVSKELDVSWYEPEVGRAIKTLEYQWNDVTQSFGSPIRQQYVFTYNRR